MKLIIDLRKFYMTRFRLLKIQEIFRKKGTNYVKNFQLQQSISEIFLFAVVDTVLNYPQNVSNLV